MANEGPIQWRVRLVDTTESTQTLVSQLGIDEAPEGTVVAAKRQTAGRGRHGRSWASPEGGLYMSLLLRPPSSVAVQTITLVAAAAVVRGVEEVSSLRAQIRWPNDIMIEGKKVSGVIAESSYRGRALSFVTVGIGVNCNSSISSGDIGGDPVTSLSQELGRKLDIVRLRRSILDAFGELYTDWLRGSDAVKIARGRISTLGKRVIITTTSGRSIEGVAVAVEPTGGLVLKADGRKLTLHSQDVELLRET